VNNTFVGGGIRPEGGDQVVQGGLGKNEQCNRCPELKKKEKEDEQL
jgi:hypothetical protein